MKHPNARYRAHLKPRCSRASMRGARLALAIPGLSATLENAYALAFAQQDATPAERWREWCDTGFPYPVAPLSYLRAFGAPAGAKK